MQTRTYGDLFKITSALIGTGGQLDVTEQDQLSHFINRRFQQAFDESPVWPRYSVVGEPRTIVPGQTIQTSEDSFHVYGAGTTAANGLYKRNGTVNAIPAYTLYDTDGTTALYSLVSGGAGGDGFLVLGTPLTSNTNLYEAGMEGSGDAEYAAGQWTGIDSGTAPAPFVVDVANIGEFERIHRQQPFFNNSAKEYEFFVTSRGAEILNIANTTDGIAFVTYKKEFTPFTVTSDYYNSVVEVPGEFFNYIAHAVYADFLRVQNRQEQALAEEQVAQTYLALELEKIDIRSNNNTINKRFSTYVNRQSR
jgi:hypothetical protein